MFGKHLSEGPDHLSSFCTGAKGPNVRRTLVLLTKTMQNLANGTRFFKAPYLKCYVPPALLFLIATFVGALHDEHGALDR